MSNSNDPQTTNGTEAGCREWVRENLDPICETGFSPSSYGPGDSVGELICRTTNVVFEEIVCHTEWGQNRYGKD